jgi:hypothetical protein
MTTTLPFISNDWTIQLTSIPDYKDLQGKFTQPLDYHILEMMATTDHTKITTEMKAEITSKLLPNIDMRTGILTVSNYQTYGIGRVYANGNNSIIPMARAVKHTVLKYMGWLDIDMIKGHMTIAYEMGKSIGLEFKSINRYITHFDEVCDEMREFYQTDGYFA